MKITSREPGRDSSKYGHGITRITANRETEGMEWKTTNTLHRKAGSEGKQRPSK